MMIIGRNPTDATVPSKLHPLWEALGGISEAELSRVLQRYQSVLGHAAPLYACTAFGIATFLIPQIHIAQIHATPNHTFPFCA
jgi:hypothetical protein